MEYGSIADFAQVMATLLVGGGQIGLIWWGLEQMKQASQDRNRQLDLMEARQQQQSDVLAELLRRSNPSN